ncbi:MAG TPA: pantetheine-phosphate adenylyltransferase [Actinomycetota bacterium]|nr:pantetheine-phosphate adenylyltransferase [Actinomycetota bacterium]
MKAIYPGTFDPITNGHLDIIERASSRFAGLVVAVSQNPGKSPLFTLEERVALAKEVVSRLPNVEIGTFEGLLVDYARREGIGVIVKGLRAVTDFDYELQMAQMNHKLAGVETFFMAATPKYSFLSSSLVKEVARFGGDVSAFVPSEVARTMKERFRGE